MNQNKILRYLIPIAAIVVLFESVLLIMNLKDKEDGSVTVRPGVTKTEEMGAFAITVDTESKEMTLNKGGLIEVKAMANDVRSLDSVNVYLKYNPSAFKITDLVFDERLPEPTFSKASEQKGLVVINFLISEADGVKVEAGESLSLVKFLATPKMTGNYDFEISTGNEAKESATMFVENATSKVLPFTSSKLTVSVTK